MGSLLLFNGVSSTELKEEDFSSIFVPFYCPVYNSDITDLSAGGTVTNQPMPLFMASWLEMNSHDATPKLKKMVRHGPASADTASVLFKSFAETNSSAAAIKTITAAASATTASRITPKFDVNVTNKLFLYNGDASAASTSSSMCTGFSLFLKNDFIFEDTVSSTGLGDSDSIGIYSGNKFYVYGVDFNKAIFTGLKFSVGMNAITDNSLYEAPTKAIVGNLDSANYYTGIKRPSVDYFVVNGEINTTNQIGFFCTNGLNAHNKYSSNLITVTNDNLVVFFLDWGKKEKTTDLGGGEFNVNSAYQDDNGLEINFTFKTPNAVPAFTQFEFKSSTNFNSNTICGLIQQDLVYIDECNNSSDMKCTTQKGGEDFEVCCYNLKSGSVVKLDELNVIFPTPQILSDDDSKYNQLIYETSDEKLNSYEETLANLEDFKTNIAQITSVDYYQVNQLGGIGKATFSIELKRQSTRNMIIKVSGNMESMNMNNISQRCHASFAKDTTIGSNSKWENGDILIDSCNASLSNSVPIEVRLKNIIYKCGLTFQKTLYVSVWPIKIINWTPETLVTVEISDNLVGSQPMAIPFSNKLDVEPEGQFQSEDLCSVTSILPSIPGEVGDYVFVLDLEKVVNK